MPPNASTDSLAPVTAIEGGVIGGVAAILLIVTRGIILYRHSRRQQDDERPLEASATRHWIPSGRAPTFPIEIPMYVRAEIEWGKSEYIGACRW